MTVLDYGYLQASADAYELGGYVYRTRGGPWKVGFHHRPVPKAGGAA